LGSDSGAGAGRCATGRQLNEAILDQADELRRLRQKSIERLRALGQSIFYEMFGDAATKWSRWPSFPLTEFGTHEDDIKCGPFGTQLHQREFTAEGVPLWGIKHVNSGFELATDEFITETKFRSLRSYSLESGDIVMTRKGTVGNCAVYPDGAVVGVMHSDLLRLRINKARHNAQFVAAQLRYSPSFMHQLSLISPGAIMAGINVTKLKSLVAIAPPKEQQDAYAVRIAQVAAQIETMRVHQRRTESLFASLQQRAFAGEL
jgi:type I restriction enzyme S subunit